MIYDIKRCATVPSELTVSLPASKSISNRALILNALSRSGKEIHNLAKCDDTDVLVAALTSNGTHFDIGAAGTAMRFLTAYQCLQLGEWTITGSERMKQRPIQVLVEALRRLGATIDYAGVEGFPPLKIKGHAMDGGEIEIDGGVSSQYISALLMIAPYLKNGLTLHLTGAVISRPYILMTLQLMAQFGVEAEWKDENTIQIKPQEYKPIEYTVESDWSASSYWYEIATFLPKNATRFTLPHLYEQSLQGDSQVRKIFEPLGIATTFTVDGVVLEKTADPVSHYEYDFSGQPDLAQTVVATCCAIGTTFRFSGLKTLKIKETDRIAALINECRKLGYVLKETGEGELSWNGERVAPDTVPLIATYKDHRMAMAFAPIALQRNGQLQIDDPEVVSKSYPEYWKAVERVIECKNV